MGHPSKKDFQNMVNAGMIPNFPVILDDIKNINTIFGPNIPSLKVEMVRRQHKPTVSNYAKIPKEILQLYNMVPVAVGIIFVKRIAFLVSTFRYVKFTMVQ